MKILSKNTKEPEEYKDGYTVGELLDYIEKHNIPRDGKVLIQRLEDKYFEGCDISGMGGYKNPDGSSGQYPPGSKSNPWDSIKRPDFSFHLTKEKVEDIETNPDQYPKITPEILKSMKDSLEDGSYMNEYVIIHSPVGYDDYKHLYLDAHY